MKVKSESEVAQSYLTLRDPMDCSPPGSSVHGILQARVLEWGAIAFSDIHTHTDFYLFLAMLGLCCHSGFSLVTGSRGSSICGGWASLVLGSRVCKLQ